MKWKLSFAFMLALVIGSVQLALWAEEPKGTAKDDTATVKTSKQFMNSTWKKIQKKTFEVQKATTVAGVRGAEAEDEVLNRLYYKGSGKAPTRKQLKEMIDILQKGIDANPKAPDVGETKLYIAQCYTLLGNTDEATKIYNEIIKESPDSEWSVSAKKELSRLTKAEKTIK